MKRTLLLVGVVAAMMAGGQVAAADGKAVFDKTCKGCHTVMTAENRRQGRLGAADRAGRSGADRLSVMKGKKPMPPKGGAASEADVKAAVEYIISQSK